MNVCLSFPHPSTFNPLLCTSKTQLLHLHSNSTTILFSFSFPFHSVHRIPQLDKKRRRFVTWASSLQLPLLPFPIDQSLFKKKRFFVHFVLDPIAINDTSGEASFAARYGCLVAIEKVEKLEIGALVSIRGIGRAKILKFEQAEPYLTGAVIPLLDNIPHGETELSSKVLEIKEALRNLNSLEIKLKAPQEALLQTLTANSLKWSEKTPVPDCDNSFIPPFPELVSFAALQPVSGSSESELQKLQKKKLRAMDIRDTLERLEDSIGYVQENISLVAAKLAIQSLDSRS
ncbi:uncharacterized protein LOC107761402 isoform X2 [Nicotiana tabacum]|uniref:Uncharacterized protein LOC107761402 isoform X2 n=2 Tax=Nicotiana TaxID=4085 RepID=A0A1S3X553_TOBAC|nr:PREDICTED: uncharacterized protein LOC104237992 isoform X2 [Nicotiana sylvestris]XP_016435115.1 PREDICTED: uncharacterized protein LOC107761402 isoform X2 [Nicotiana tabacum]